VRHFLPLFQSSIGVPRAMPVEQDGARKPDGSPMSGFVAGRDLMIEDLRLGKRHFAPSRASRTRAQGRPLSPPAPTRHRLSPARSSRDRIANRATFAVPFPCRIFPTAHREIPHPGLGSHTARGGPRQTSNRRIYTSDQRDRGNRGGGARLVRDREDDACI